MKFLELKTIKQSNTPTKPDNVDAEAWDKIYTVDYKELIKLALTERQLSAYGDFKQTGKILDALNSATKYLVLDDADFEYLITKAIVDLRFTRYSKEVEDFLNEVNNPQSGMPEDAK